jgi:hypothetical protein
MNRIIKGIIIVIAITSMLIVVATSMTPIMQNSFASQGNTTTTTSSSSPATGNLVIVLDNPGSISTTFPITVTGNNPQPSAFALSAENPQIVTLGPGPFAVSTDISVSLYYSKDCKGTISAGQNLQCLITTVPPR